VPISLSLLNEDRTLLELREVLISSYDDEPGVFRWVKESEFTKLLDVAGQISDVKLSVGGQTLGQWPVVAAGRDSLRAWAKCVRENAAK
jgi:hypothetical protein